MVQRSPFNKSHRGKTSSSSCGRATVVSAIFAVVVVMGWLLAGRSTLNMDSLLLLSPSVVSTSTKTTSTSTTTCNPISSRVISDKIVIDFNAVQTMSKDRLSQLKQFTVQRYEKFAMAPPGREHYTLLEYLISTYAPVETNPCATVIQQQQQQQHRRHVGDIGTRYAASALALGASHGTVVRTFDLPNSKERREAFRGRSEEDWQAAVLAAGVHITFENVNLATVPDEDFRVHTATWFLSLDTHHLPYTVPFEREFFKRLAESGYQGMLFLDDIHLNAEMKKWWAELLENASSMGYRCFDLTAVGHSTGSGLVDFSGKVELIK